MCGFEVHAPTRTFATCRVFSSLPSWSLYPDSHHTPVSGAVLRAPPHQELVAMEESLMKQQLKERYRGTRSALLLKGK
jgi:hypothetical protein